MSNYQSFKQRIDSAKPSDYDRLAISLDRLWIAGVFSVVEFQRLDAYMLDKLKG